MPAKLETWMGKGAQSFSKSDDADMYIRIVDIGFRYCMPAPAGCKSTPRSQTGPHMTFGKRYEAVARFNKTCEVVAGIGHAGSLG